MEPAPPDNLPEFSVSELAGAVKRTVETAFGRVRLRGEVGRVSLPRSGHCYLTLKDADAVIDGVVWKGVLGRLDIRPEEGLEVVVTGKLTTYPGRSSYQIIIESMTLAGEGALLKLLEQRRKALTAAGLFDSARKMALPHLPRTVGVVTSPTGAVIRDILHRLSDRFPVRVLVWPVRVQGDGAAAEIAAAIQGFEALLPDGTVPRPDVLIVARGGGSLEDLWAFNEEAVVRAVAACTIPLVSAVGHETDTTLIDFAADVRAPTPTAAAELVVPVRAELVALLDDRRARLGAAVTRTLRDRTQRVEALRRGLPDARELVARAGQRLDDFTARMTQSQMARHTLLAERVAGLGAQLRTPRQMVRQMRQALSQSAQHLDRALRQARRDRWQALASSGKLLESYAFHRVLERGFVLVRDADGHVLSRAATVPQGAALSLQFVDGTVQAATSGAAKPPRKPRKKPVQTDLFGGEP